MELLVATLAHTTKGNDADALARVRLISETIRNAPGIINVRFYHSREGEAYYFMLTTWEDEEFWQKAQDRYNPKDLLLGSTSELLVAAPEQWLTYYLWGYSRPSAKPVIAAAHLATVRADQADRIQRGWIESLRRQAVQPTLAFAFLARGRNDDSASPVYDNASTAGNAHQFSSTFLNLLSWSGETQQKEFYSDQNYKAINNYLNSAGVVRVLALDPL